MSEGDGRTILGYEVRADEPGLSTRQRAEIRAFAEAFFARDEGPPDDARLDWFVDDFDDFVGHLGGRARLLIASCLLTLTHLAPALVGKPGSRLKDLPLTLRIDAIEKVEKSGASIALFAIKAVASLCYYEHDDAAREIGWDRECMGARS